MSRLVESLAGELRRDVAYRELYVPHAAREVVPDHDGLYAAVARTIGPSRPVAYLEFGVADGTSMSKISRLFTHPESLFIGFDSFLGLPEAWLMHGQGAFSQDGRPPPVPDARVGFVKGWFQNTLHETLANVAIKPRHDILVHYDADLWSSTMFVLTSLWPMFDEYYFIMDDFMQDDIVALYDFSLAFPVDLKFITRRDGGLPHTVFGHMRRKEFMPSVKPVAKVRTARSKSTRQPRSSEPVDIFPDSAFARIRRT